MTRGVSQLLFNYLPGRTVDWEDGLAIVQLTGVHLGDAWTSDRARLVLEEVAELLDRWRALGGAVDPNFPDPRRAQGRFTLGTPIAVDATVLHTAYLCQRCHALAFPRQGDLAADGQGQLQCKGCGARALRQFGQVFVHGCGELETVQAFLPYAKSDQNGVLTPGKRPLRCSKCGDQAILEMPARSERVADMKVICRSCRGVVLDRITARCPRCTAKIGREQKESGTSATTSPVARIAMRMSRYSANDTYYAQTLTILRLDKPALTTEEDLEQKELRSLLPLNARPDQAQDKAEVIAALTERLRRADAIGDPAERARLLQRIAAVAVGNVETAADVRDEPPSLEPDITKAVRESLAFRTTVTSRSAAVLARESSAGRLLSDRTAGLQRTLGLRDVALVDDLPVISATFGYTRRSFQPTYDELGAQRLPTEIRVFPSLDEYAAMRLGRQDLVGTVPILSREGEHQGLFLSLDPNRVVTWLEANGIRLSDGVSPITRILSDLEPIDRYYDRIWSCPVRRLVFGLLHTLSHAAMRAVSWFAGLERTSLSEYLFLPLLGTVVFDTSGAFQLGGIETLVRDHLCAFLEQLPNEALTCIYDADCIDARGACHGCVHSPEIACRVFNHGLSRAFLLGGHHPWEDVSVDRQIVGYWQGADGA